MSNIKTQTVETWKAQIYVGLKRGYSTEILTIDKVYRTIQEYVDEFGWCVTVTPTKFIYMNGHEPGVIIEAIQYPRFPETIKRLEEKVMELAEILLSEMDQYRVSICFPEKTIMLEREDV